MLEAKEQENIDKYIALCKGKSHRAMQIIELLTDRDYFVQPAGMKHHGNYIGGLFEHSYVVTRELLYLTNKLGLVWSQKDSPIIIGLLHDLCKLDDYRLRKADNELGYEILWNKEMLYAGHGEKSLIMALELVEYLTSEEMACIRYHMGAFTDKQEWEFYSRAVETFPNVLYVHTADMIASKVRKV